MQSVITQESVVVVAGEQVSSNLGSEVVILSLQEGKYYGLDPVGSRLWELIQEPLTVLEVRDRLLEEFEVDADRCLADLLALLQDLAARNLVEVQHPVSGKVESRHNR